MIFVSCETVDSSSALRAAIRRAFARSAPISSSLAITGPGEEEHGLAMRDHFGLGDQVAPALLAKTAGECIDALRRTIGILRQGIVLAREGLRGLAQGVGDVVNGVRRTGALLFDQRLGGVPHLVENLLGDATMLRGIARPVTARPCITGAPAPFPVASNGERMASGEATPGRTIASAAAWSRSVIDFLPENS